MMEIAIFEKKIQMQFDALIKCVVKRKVKNYNRTRSRINKREISFSSLNLDLEELSEMQTYNLEDDDYFDLGVDRIKVNNAHLAKALKTLPQKQQAIILKFYFLEMSDKEIASSMNIGRNTSLRQRKKSLEKIKTEMLQLREYPLI